MSNNFFVSVVFLFVFSLSFSQSNYEGDKLKLFLSKKSDSQEMKDLKANYKCEMANQNHYVSQSGVELKLSNDTLTEINLYKGSAAFGDYKGKLPKNLKFGMRSGDVKGILGRPIVSYSSGYCEFDLKDCVLSCWFDKGLLTQVGLTVK